MDLDRLVRRASEQLAAQPSRRGIAARVAKLAVGVGAMLVGLGGPNAAGAQIGNTCCQGGPRCPKKDGQRRRCPGDSKVTWRWFCETDEGVTYLCNDCKNKRGEDVCVYSRRK
jgi:hypothetical protein